jgi:hypothetical protein
MTTGSRIDLPDGQISKFLSSPLCKNISLSPSGKSSLQVRAIPSREEGRIMIVTNVGMGCGGRGSVLRATGLQGGLAKGL